MFKQIAVIVIVLGCSYVSGQAAFSRMSALASLMGDGGGMRGSGAAGMGSGMGAGMGAGMGTGMGTSMGTGMGAGMNTGMGAGMNTGMGTGMNTGMGASMAGSMGMMGAMGAMGRRFSNILNNPMFLCRETENMRPFPCSRTPQMCDLQSMRSYGMPGLMKCSPVGFGCCLKDFMSLQMSRWAN